MDKLKEAIQRIGRDIGNIEGRQASSLTTTKAYELFPTYATLQNQMTTNIKDKHLELGLDALIDSKLANGGDPFITKSKLPDVTQLATKKDLEAINQRSDSPASPNAGTELKGQGFPYNLNAEIGTTYIDTTAKNGAVKWLKVAAGTGTGAWAVLYGNIKYKPKNINSAYGSAYVEFQRSNSIVELNFGGLSWGWFGIKRKGAPGYVAQGSDRERNVTLLPINGLPLGFRPAGSKLGLMTNDKGLRLGTVYVGGKADNNHLRLQFDDPVPTDRDITDLRFANVSYLTDDPWPDNL